MLSIPVFGLWNRKGLGTDKNVHNFSDEGRWGEASPDARGGAPPLMGGGRGGIPDVYLFKGIAESVQVC